MINQKEKEVLSKFTLPELQVLLGAYTYEYTDSACIPDLLYDTLAIDVEASLKEKLDDFESYTGSWIGTAIKKEELGNAIIHLAEDCLAYMHRNRGYDMVHHTIIAHVLDRKLDD